MLLQRNLQNPIEKNSHHRRNETRIGTRWTRDHNQLQRNPHVPQLWDNTWTNNRKDGSTDVKQLIRETLSSLQRDTGNRDDDMTMSGLQHVTTLGGGHGICSNTRGDFTLSTQRQRHTPNTQPNYDNLELNHDHEKEDGRTSSKTETRSSSSKRRRVKENIRRCPVTSYQRVWDRYAASTDSTNCFKEIERCRWDAILLGGTWRPAEEVWESKSDHIFMGAGGFSQKHGVQLLLNKRWKRETIKTECVSESTNQEGWCWPVSVSPHKVFGRSHSSRLNAQNILHSSRVVSTPNLLLAVDPKVTTLESTRWENPTSVVLGWSSGWWSQTAWRSTRNSKRGPETEGQSS